MKLMQPKCRRKQNRVHAVLPVRVRGVNADGVSFEAPAHTLDLTPTGVRLGAIRCKINSDDTLVVLFHHRRVEFTVMWSQWIEGSGYQVGLQTTAKETDPKKTDPKKTDPEKLDKWRMYAVTHAPRAEAA